MSIETFIQDGQDPKIVEKIYDKLVDMLTVSESIQYIALQKKPAVTILPDSITVSDKRIFLCEFTRLGLATNFEIFSWQDIKDIAFKEEIFGSKVTVIPFTGENLTIDYIPKIQARKLYQLIKGFLENKENPINSGFSKPVTAAPSVHQEEDLIADKPTYASSIEPEITNETTFEITNEAVIEHQETSFIPADAVEPEDDELTLKLKKLKSLFDRQLISQAEYENKKSELLSQL